LVALPAALAAQAAAHPLPGRQAAVAAAQTAMAATGSVPAVVPPPVQRFKQLLDGALAGQALHPVAVQECLGLVDSLGLPVQVQHRQALTLAAQRWLAANQPQAPLGQQLARQLSAGAVQQPAGDRQRLGAVQAAPVAPAAAAPPVQAPQRVADWSNNAEHQEELVKVALTVSTDAAWKETAAQFGLDVHHPSSGKWQHAVSQLNTNLQLGPGPLYSKNQVESKWTSIYGVSGG